MTRLVSQTPDTPFLRSDREDERLSSLKTWLVSDLDMQITSLTPASEDASFRRYFRALTPSGQSWIVMDAPPEKEDCRPFLAISMILRNIGVTAPQVYELDLDRGFLLLDDFGHRPYLGALNADSAEPLYRDAMNALCQIQTQGSTDDSFIPAYSREKLLDEMQLFPDWLLEKQYQLQLSDDERHLLKTAFEFLADTALEQPRVLVHRDYHSRNLMVLEKQNPGILDFQDAVIGPICYDLVSLLKDCYISWPRQQVLNWLSTYFSRPPISRLVAGAGYKQIIRWFDLMGIQRHLKASGIFARLYLRDGKSRYLNDIPRTLQYISQVVADYPELEPFAHFLEERVLPAARAQDNRIIV